MERPVSSKFVNIDEMNEPHHHHKQKKDPEKDDRWCWWEELTNSLGTFHLIPQMPNEFICELNNLKRYSVVISVNTFWSFNEIPNLQIKEAML